MPDPIEILKEDHHKVEQLFEQLGDGHFGTVQKIIQELKVHTSLEEEFVYPALRDAVDEGLADDAEGDHQDVEELIGQLEEMTAAHPAVGETLEKLKHEVEEHVAKEENELLPKLADTLSDEKLAELGGQLAGRKRELTGESATT